jgi:hypothetical protein
MAEDSSPFRSVSPSQPIAVYLDATVYETPIVPTGAEVNIIVVNADT